MNKHARIFDAVHSSREEKPGTSDAQPVQTWLKFVGVDKNAVILGWAASPGSDSMHALMMHATSPA